MLSLLEQLQSYPILLALFIFFARIADVSMGTLRTLLVFRGHALWASLIGFVEVIIWLAAAAQVIKNLDQWYYVVAYAAGFATGNTVGIWLEGKLALGKELVRVISKNRSVLLRDRLQSHNLIELEGQCDGEPVEVLFIVEKRRKMGELLRQIHELDPQAACTLAAVREAEQGLPARASLLRRLRK